MEAAAILHRDYKDTGCRLDLVGRDIVVVEGIAKHAAVLERPVMQTGLRRRERGRHQSLLV